MLIVQNGSGAIHAPVIGGNALAMTSFEGDGGQVVFLVGEDGLTVTRAVVNAAGAMQISGSFLLPISRKLGVDVGVEILDFPAGPRLAFTGLENGRLLTYVLNSAGQVGQSAWIDLGLPQNEVPLATTSVLTTDGGFIFSVSDAVNAIYVNSVILGGDIVSTHSQAAEPDSETVFGTLMPMEVGGITLLLVADTANDALLTYAVSTTGVLIYANQIGEEQGLALPDISLIETVQVAGRSFAIVGSSGNDSLTVLEVSDSGELIALDQISDDQVSMFDGLSQLSVLQVGARAFVFAGGKDGGFSMFEILPSGRLVSVVHQTNELSGDLSGSVRLEAAVVGGVIQILATSRNDADLRSFLIQIGDLGQLVETTGNGAQVSGQNSNDTIVSSHMEVLLTGHAGADHFVFDVPLGTEGSLGEITDFQVGIDRISFPQFVLAYRPEDFSFISTPDGALISYANADLLITSASGIPLEQANFSLSSLIDADHNFVGNAPGVPETNDEDPPPPEGLVLNGTAGNDRLIGENGDDTLSGGAGDDVLIGNAGNDTMFGGDGVDQLIGGDGDDFIYGGTSAADLRDVINGGAGNDSLDGGYGNDLVYGGDGNDTITGGFGADKLVGQNGNDILTGSALGDQLFGGAGSDVLNGGFGHDRLNGGSGADSFFHLGIRDHGSDWIQDFLNADGDVLVFANQKAGPEDFQVNFALTANAGLNDVSEAFVIYKPSGQIIWALIDGYGQDEIDLRIAGDSTVYDLLDW